MTKYKYYFKKPKSEITKDIFRWLAVAGIVYVAASSPYFIHNLIEAYKRSRKYRKKYDRKKIYDTFYNLKRQGYIRISKQNRQIYISLTEKGRKKASWFQIDSLKVKRPKKWDKKWRVVIFDIAELKKNSSRGISRKIKRIRILSFTEECLGKPLWLQG